MRRRKSRQSSSADYPKHASSIIPCGESPHGEVIRSIHPLLSGPPRPANKCVVTRTEMKPDATAPANDARADAIRAEGIRLQYESMPNAYFASGVLATVVAAIYLQSMPPAICITWVVAVYLHVIARRQLRQRFLRAAPPTRSGRGSRTGRACASATRGARWYCARKSLTASSRASWSPNPSFR